MKNRLIIVLLFTVNFDLLAQSNDNNRYGKIVYERVLNFDGNPSTTTFNLLFNSEFSVFYEPRANSRENATLKPTSNDEFDLSFEVKFNGSKYIVFTDLRRSIIQSQMSLFREGIQKTYIVEENISKIKWSIINEYTTINDLKAQKAIGRFRGRKYIAWFTNQIPGKYGPWKLNGLTGLILNIADERNEVVFIAKEIKIPFNISSMTKNDFEFNKDFQKISLAEYIKFKSEQVDEVKKLFLSKLPRGSKMEMTDSKSNDIELEYEEEMKFPKKN
jgi:GLPGLI family protein